MGCPSSSPGVWTPFNHCGVVRGPSDCPLTLTLLIVMPEPLGEVSEPSLAKVNVCPVFTQAGCVEVVADGSVW